VEGGGRLLGDPRRLDEANHAASANTLQFNDWGDYMYTGWYYSEGKESGASTLSPRPSRATLSATSGAT